MKKILSILLTIMLLISISTIAFAAASPTVEGIFVPHVDGTKYTTNLGHTVNLKFDPIKSINDYARIPNLLYIFQITGDYELAENEYIEIPIYVYVTGVEDINAVIYETGHELKTEQIDIDHWMFRLTEYGTVIITYI